MGNIDINLSDFYSTSCKKYVNCFLLSGFNNLINLLTRVTIFCSSLIDCILTNCDMAMNSKMILSDITDHFSVFLCLPFYWQPHVQQASVTTTIFDAEKYGSMYIWLWVWIGYGCKKSTVIKAYIINSFPSSKMPSRVTLLSHLFTRVFPSAWTLNHSCHFQMTKKRKAIYLKGSHLIKC